MSYPKLAELVTKLHKRTLSGKVDWEETSENDVYQASFLIHSIQIHTVSTNRGGSGQTDIVIEIFDDEGTKVESFSDVDIDPLIPDNNSFAMMQEIYNTARRMSLGTEKAIDEIISILDEDDELPF